MSLTKFDNITKSALWNSYNTICFYCNRPLDWDDLHIDHIIPESLERDVDRFGKVKKEYELDFNFDLNALYNLVPTHSKCNLRKSNEIFIKQTTLFYLALTNRTLNRIYDEIEKLTKRKNKGQILSKIQSALSTNLISINELQNIIKTANEKNWNIREIKLPLGVEFIDEVYDTFYLNMDSNLLYDKTLSIGGGYNSLELHNEQDEKILISTLREWQQATIKGYYPKTNFSVKLSSSFTFLEELLTAIEKAKMPSVSFISEPWVELDQLDLLSPSIIHDFEGKIEGFATQGLSVGNLVNEGIVKINDSGIYKISLEYEGIETSLVEQFRADFNNDGIEDIFVKGWTRAIGGTLGYGFTTILTRYSNNHLLEEIR